MEQQVLHSLLIDLDLDLMLLAEILEFTFFVPELCLFVFQLLFANDPEIVNSLTLVLVEARQVFFLANLRFEGAALDAKRLLVVLVIYVVDGLGLGAGFVSRPPAFLGLSAFFGGIFIYFI